MVVYSYFNVYDLTDCLYKFSCKDAVIWYNWYYRVRM